MVGLAFRRRLGGRDTAIAMEAELVASALSATAARMHLSTYFLGVVVLALVGTSADLFAAAFFARQDRMGLVMGICIGSAIQMALVVAPPGAALAGCSGIR